MKAKARGERSVAYVIIMAMQSPPQAWRPPPYFPFLIQCSQWTMFRLRNGSLDVSLRFEFQ